jgi:tripartite-type tricarboxylate transporter receptor subunit TctC
VIKGVSCDALGKPVANAAEKSANTFFTSTVSPAAVDTLSDVTLSALSVAGAASAAALTASSSVMVKSGKVKVIAISGDKRSPLLPNVPTFAESGFPAVVSYAWYGFFAPAKTPKEIIAKINGETLKIMKEPAFQKILADTGSDFVGDTPENFAAFVKAESAKWSKVVKDSGATVD